MSKNLTKWTYTIYNSNGDLIAENILYKELELLGFKNVIATFNKKKINDVIFKKHRIIRINNKDIVQASEKSDE